MSNFVDQAKLWDDFLLLWPIERLAKMTLDEYSRAGSKDSFTYWIESRLDVLGSIWGGSSFKFGVFSRKNDNEKPTDAKLSYSDTYGWYSSLGATAAEAFEKVKAYVVEIATLASKGDLDAIENFQHVGEAYKWKIAFHYQNRSAPSIVNVFTKAPLSVFVGNAKSDMAVLQRAACLKRPVDLGILEFGEQIWSEWSKMNLKIWKLSHGKKIFSDDERQRYLEDRLAVMYGKTDKGQGEAFIKAPIGTLFYLCHGNEFQRIGEFTSVAEPCDKGEGWVQRGYRVLKAAVDEGPYTGSEKGWTPNFQSTFKLVGKDDLPQFERTLLTPYFGISLAELGALAGGPDQEMNLLAATSPQPAKDVARMTPINRIYYGPPGTGKTHALVELLKRDYEQPMQSVSAQEWEKQFILENVAVLTWWEGAAAALYELGGQAKVAQLFAHPFIQAIAAFKARDKYIQHTLWGTLQHHTVDESITVNIKRRFEPAIFDKSKDSGWSFAGDWPDAGADLIALVEQFKRGRQGAGAVKRHSFVTFHQSYGYEEFVEGLRPKLIGDTEVEQVGYEIRPGAFKELCRKARQAPDQRFAMVIDEINRGNISKIFGELITLIEADKREGAEHAISVTLPYSGEPFSVPPNVDIIGTMNTADRSLALVDTALRRRFDFVPQMPDARNEEGAPLHQLRVTLAEHVIDVPAMLQAINQRVETLYDRDHTIGHAYFLPLKMFDDGDRRFEELARIFRNRVLPLLEEYFFDDWQKIRLVLADNQKADAAQFVTVSNDHDADLTKLFGNEHGLNSFATRRRYAKQEAAFDKIEAYVGIYQTLAP